MIRIRDISLAFAGPPLLDKVNLSIEKGERVCLIGRNGVGKSSLFRIISGELEPDSGELIISQSVTIAQLAQSIPLDVSQSVFEVVAGGLPEVAPLLIQLKSDPDTVIDTCQIHHDEQILWGFLRRIDIVLSKLKLESDVSFSSLSGGFKRRVLLARALVIEPDCLLLDEPTNHLDLDGILWLEEWMHQFKGAIFFISHDRTFLTRTATRIVELDRGQLYDYPGDYPNFLRRQADRLAVEEKATSEFDKKLVREEVWIRQGVKARRTRNEGRVRSLHKLRETYQVRRNLMERPYFKIGSTQLSGKIVFEVNNLGFTFPGCDPVIKDFNALVLRGDKIGILGPNGVGKSTLIQCLLGDKTPTHGYIERGTQLQVAYFDQMRSQIDDDLTLIENVGQGSDTIMVEGQARHVISYCQDFLFSPDRAHCTVRKLSGGERNRLLLAKLFARSANVLVLDEPSNDLDLESLELLESILVNFKGTVLLISHDRSLLDNVVTSTWVFEQDGHIGQYAGGYSDYLIQAKPNVPIKSEKSKGTVQDKGNLSDEERRELKRLPRDIEKLEERISDRQHVCSDPDVYGDHVKLAQIKRDISELEKSLQVLYSRWESLEAKEK